MILALISIRKTSEAVLTSLSLSSMITHSWKIPFPLSNQTLKLIITNSESVGAPYTSGAPFTRRCCYPSLCHCWWVRNTEPIFLTCNWMSLSPCSFFAAHKTSPISRSSFVTYDTMYMIQVFRSITGCAISRHNSTKFDHMTNLNLVTENWTTSVFNTTIQHFNEQ